MNKVYYKNRELSWLQFNERVLNEAGDPKVPIGERLNFLAIYQSNLDEFCMVRVGTLMQQIAAKVVDDKTGMSAKSQVKEIFTQMKLLEKKKEKIYDQLLGELEPKSFHLINFKKISKIETEQLEKYFEEKISPYLSPMILMKHQTFPFLHNNEIYAIARLKGKNGKKRIGIVPCSNPVFDRLIPTPGRQGFYMLSEEIILEFLNKMFPSYDIVEKFLIRVTRNASISIDEMYDEDLDYRGAMEQMLERRDHLNPVRVEFSSSVSKDLKKELSKYLQIANAHMMTIGTPLDLSFVYQIRENTNIRNDITNFYPKQKIEQNTFLHEGPIIPQIENHDVLIQYPHESMKTFINLLHEAGNSDNVKSISITLYRVAKQSRVVDALCEAAENGKEVTVLLELRARFDEANNIQMSRRLEDAGCKVIYGLDHFKVHSKICLIEFRDDYEFRYLSHIGTGNFNEKSAQIYTDLALLTADYVIGTDLKNLFESLKKGVPVMESEVLMVSPNCLTTKIIDRIQEQMSLAMQGKSGYIAMKMNSLTDKDLIDALIDASRAGVQIKLIVRGICCLIPGIPGVSENIEVHSLVGRYLEHSRIYVFGLGENAEYYISSADLMTRNTKRRVEVAAPIGDPTIKRLLAEMINGLMHDTENRTILKSDGRYYSVDSGDWTYDAQAEYFFKGLIYDRTTS